MNVTQRLQGNRLQSKVHVRITTIAVLKFIFTYCVDQTSYLLFILLLSYRELPLTHFLDCVWGSRL